MANALIGPADLTGTALAVVVVVVAALSSGCLLVAGRAAYADRPLPRELLIATGAGIQLLLVLAPAMFAVQATIEILAAIAP